MERRASLSRISIYPRMDFLSLLAVLDFFEEEEEEKTHLRKSKSIDFKHLQHSLFYSDLAVFLQNRIMMLSRISSLENKYAL